MTAATSPEAPGSPSSSKPAARSASRSGSLTSVRPSRATVRGFCNRALRSPTGEHSPAPQGTEKPGGNPLVGLPADPASTRASASDLLKKSVNLGASARSARSPGGQGGGENFLHADAVLAGAEAAILEFGRRVDHRPSATPEFHADRAVRRRDLHQFAIEDAPLDAVRADSQGAPLAKERFL